jgi:dihydrofolate reductase
VGCQLPAEIGLFTEPRRRRILGTSPWSGLGLPVRSPHRPKGGERCKSPFSTTRSRSGSWCATSKRPYGGTKTITVSDYEGARGFWPQQKDNASAPPSDQEFSRLYDDIEKVVVSDHASLPQEGHPWAGTTRIVKREDAREEITSLKEQDGGEIVMWGSRTLWNDLLVHGLVDELHVIIGAALLGSGTRTFGDFSASLRRIETRPFDGSDSVLIRYEVLQT